MIRPALLALVTALSSCLGPQDEGLPPVGEAAEAAAREACMQRGGTFAPGGKAGAMTCFTVTPDAGAQCSAEDECSTVCLARSRTCAPITPLFGCNDILTAEGVRVTQCID